MPKAHITKAETDKWDFVKLRNFCALKDTTNRVNGKKISGNHILNKELISRTYKELLQHNKKMNDLMNEQSICLLLQG